MFDQKICRFYFRSEYLLKPFLIGIPKLTKKSTKLCCIISFFFCGNHYDQQHFQVECAVFCCAYAFQLNFIYFSLSDSPLRKVNLQISRAATKKNAIDSSG